LTGIAALALCFLAAPARAQQPAPTPVAPAAEAPPSDTAFPLAAPAAAPPADAAPLSVQAAPSQPTASFIPSPESPGAQKTTQGASLARRWWFWAGLGAAAVGLVFAAIALSPRDPYTGNATPGITSPF
jgi:hypothetical protein